MAIDACLLHGLKRRALGLFKTNSSTALIQKVAKNCNSAQEVVDMVEEEERRLLSEQNNWRKYSTAPTAANQEVNSFGRMAHTMNRSPIKQYASNSNVQKRNMWIKCALIEKKLVDIVDYLAENASRYYEPEALLSNFLCAQILSSLLMGPSALEFSRSKTNDHYLFEDPSADELLKRHKLTNPVACLCAKQTPPPPPSPTQHQQLARSITDSQQQQVESRLVRTANSLNVSGGCCSITIAGSPPEPQQNHHYNHNSARRPSIKDGSRRRPLSLKTNTKCGGTLPTECHHYSCQEISEHQQPRGYSFLSSSSLVATRPSLSPNSCSPSMLCQPPVAGSTGAGGNSGAHTNGGSSSQQNDWALWSPRMLHETLHQNSKSNLLYAKNNVLLETQPNETIAGYLSLHQTNTDLILKWIPNHMINGGQLMPVSTSIQQVDEAADEESSAASTVAAAREQDSSNPSNGGNRTTAMESSYLDLVVNLSVSRIVLLHCQFGKRTGGANRATTESLSSLDGNCPSLEQLDYNSKPANQVEALDSRAPPNRVPQTEETLILIEADGVQRSPFKFPKGGLRVFLSCLENGLLPNRYLDPAIRFDDSWPPEDTTSGAATPSSVSAADDSSQTTTTEPFTSRFDNFLKRLPSLKNKPSRATTPCDDHKPTTAALTTATDSGSSRNGSPDPLTLANLDQQQQQSLTKLPTNNCVYRIVSLQQLDWPQQTPPHSALSVGSSSSGSFNVNGQQAYGKQSVSGQRFRWSLSRLARFSARYTNSVSSSSSSVGGLFGNHSNSTLPTGSLASLATCNQASSLISENPGYSIGACSADFNSLMSEDGVLRVTDSTDYNSAKSDQQSARELARIEAKLKALKESSSGDDAMQALRTQSIQTLCDSMRKQIVARAFNGWLAHCRKTKIIRAHLSELVKEENNLIDESEDFVSYEEFSLGLTKQQWELLMKKNEGGQDGSALCRKVNQLVYYGGIEDDELRKEVWPFLLEHYKFDEGPNERRLKDETVHEQYESCGREWIKIERVVKQRDNEILAANMARVSNRSKAKTSTLLKAEVRDKNVDSNNNGSKSDGGQEPDSLQASELSGSLQEPSSLCLRETERESEDEDQLEEEEDEEEPVETNKPESVQSRAITRTRRGSRDMKDTAAARRRRRTRARLESTGSVGSDASITDQFGNNIHRIDKDVQRCDRNFWYFKEPKNLDKLRNIMCSYVWQHLDVGYVQGMCDLAAPFLVIFDDEVLAYSCFSQLMKRMVANFPHGNAMDQHFERLKHLMQVLDPKLFDVLQSNGDYTHFYFCYRWLLLDFKRGKFEVAYLYVISLEMS